MVCIKSKVQFLSSFFILGFKKWFNWIKSDLKLHLKLGLSSMDKTCKSFQNGNWIIVGDIGQYIIMNRKPWWGKQKDII
jgi:hypothetical protein